jgi:hypothetical protein
VYELIAEMNSEIVDNDSTDPIPDEKFDVMYSWI